ncbi:tropinone reductase-like 3 isoform X2 [Humulus lupulus]|uniref:tropinone reductase-like 3 isoform X2 n=1 Tax=Humulus lupulus TaxID=3486 RepID=UPI002B4162F0|nr:tropinone reductase-like 3 isoform X2 [Humulus lupulus]
MMSKRFQGKVVIVTASTQGIGYSIAQRLGLEGASVVISSRKQENVDEATEKLKGQGIQVLGLVCHVSNAQQRKDLIYNSLEKFGKIDVIVSNAAVNPMAGKNTVTIMETQESILDKMWEVNVKAPVLLTKEAAPHLKKGSSIIFISSISAYNQPLPWAMYAVTKTALLGLTKKKVILSSSLLKRFGTTEDIAAAVAFLASDDASYITGETLVVAGGTPSRL